MSENVNTENDNQMSSEETEIVNDSAISSDVDAVGTDGATDEIVNDEKSDGGENADNDPAKKLRILEALLFASDEMLTPAKLKTLIPDAPDARTIRKMVAELNAQLASEGHPFEVVEAGGGYQFRTNSAYHVYVRKLYKERVAKKLSLQALECLAIIAYRQPISKAEVETIRGVLSDGAMKTLLERKLVDIAGRSDKPGRPLLYGTTGDFLRYFGINKISDLPQIEEFEAMAKQKLEVEIESEEKESESDNESVNENENEIVNESEVINENSNETENENSNSNEN